MSKKYADIAGAIANSYDSGYSSGNTMSHKFDRLGTLYWSDPQQTYLFRYFTSSETTQSKCYSTDGILPNNWVEQDVKKWASDGSPLSMFDDIGNGPTAFRVDSCVSPSDTTVWASESI